jgi:hypothetical protein
MLQGMGAILVAPTVIDGKSYVALEVTGRGESSTAVYVRSADALKLSRALLDAAKRAREAEHG